jgi:hypothetical protein
MRDHGQHRVRSDGGLAPPACDRQGHGKDLARKCGDSSPMSFAPENLHHQHAARMGCRCRLPIQIEAARCQTRHLFTVSQDGSQRRNVPRFRSPIINQRSGGGYVNSASSVTGIDARCLNARRQAGTMAEDWLPITSSSGATAAPTHSTTCVRFAHSAMGCAMVTGADVSCRG